MMTIFVKHFLSVVKWDLTDDVAISWVHVMVRKEMSDE